MAETNIAWTEMVWNPVRGCGRVSAGCNHCYAERMATRFSGSGQPYEGLVRDGRWNGEVRFVPEMLGVPLRWRKPRRVFVNSMSDLFHPKVTDEQIAAVFGVMAACPQHCFQVLTKRPERMVEWFWWVKKYGGGLFGPFGICAGEYGIGVNEEMRQAIAGIRWPLPNVWLGVTAENQTAADKRIPLLLQVPAAVRFVSCEPLLEEVRFVGPAGSGRIDWVIVGGESGPQARPCNVEWIRSIVRQCKEAGTSVFVKQLGARIAGRDCEHGRAGETCRTVHPSGADPAEWPEDLRIREYPQ